MSEEPTEESDGVESVASRWTPEELNGKTVCFTETGGREDVLWVGVLHAELVGDAPGRLVVRVTAGPMGFDMNQDMMEAMIQGSGQLRSNFHISLPMLPVLPWGADEA